MNQTMYRIEEMLETALQLSDRISAAMQQTPSPIAGVRESVANLLANYKESTSLPNRPGQANDLRSGIAVIRHEIHQCRRVLEQLTSDSAQLYRELIGDDKDAFERMTPKQQQRKHPTAFHAKQTFHSLSQLEEALALTTSALMTLSGDLEHNMLEHLEVPDVGHFKVEDNTPVRPTLAP
ncbi:hypothetical protein [Paenibacillus xerothermodurans]|uniref:Uncharacterized protein n=1 Tax=Paenibacillus xerothermodurans TaxID=1977292 RepID=A0A2W1P0M1_PAEXE|nr:hypothetical protein [Paenibacillus xerothermodurans]PZE21292.1 hypothetical protein CBW46_007955 [Paenibacillus xerothermodurans]